MLQWPRAPGFVGGRRIHCLHRSCLMGPEINMLGPIALFFPNLVMFPSDLYSSFPGFSKSLLCLQRNCWLSLTIAAASSGWEAVLHALWSQQVGISPFKTSHEMLKLSEQCLGSFQCCTEQMYPQQLLWWRPTEALQCGVHYWKDTYITFSLLCGRAVTSIKANHVLNVF